VKLEIEDGRPVPWWVTTPKGRFRLAVEPVSTVAESLHSLQAAHFAETDPLSKGHEFKPDYPYYLARAARGRFIAIIARTEEMQPIGYLAFRIDPSAITGSMAAIEELWYIIPEQRGTVLAQRMIEYFETIARYLGLAELYMGYSKKSASALYERAGLECLAVVYGKVLTDETAQVA
jgi:GNAT superfamily N-acetyltransferase